MKKFVIKKGSHFSGTYWELFLRMFRGRVSRPGVVSDFRFTRSCLAKSIDPLDVEDMAKDRHKLFGVSESTDPHINSARIAWVEVGGRIGLFTYIYANGQRQSMQHITNVPVDLRFKAEVYYDGEAWHFAVWGPGIGKPSGSIAPGRIELAQVVPGEPKRLSSYCKLYPYYGGNYPAPMDTVIYLSDGY